MLAAVFNQGEAVHQMLLMFGYFAVIIGAFLGSMLSILGALLGLHWGIQKFTAHVIGINMPGMTNYNPRLGTIRPGRGEQVAIPKGGRIF